MSYKFANFWDVAISQAVTAGATTLYVDSDDAALLPSLGAGDEIRCVLYTDEDTREIISITGVSGGTLTIERAKESTTAQAWPAGTRLVATVTGEQLQIVNSTAPHFIAASASRSGNDYTVTVVGDIPALNNSEELSFTIPGTNTGNPVRVKVTNGTDETSWVEVLLPGGLAPDAGDFESGFKVTLRYFGSNYYVSTPASYQGVFRQINEGPVGRPNMERNSRFEAWNGGTSFSSPASLTAICDGWYVQHDGTISTYTVSRQTFTLGQTDVPFDPKYFLRWDHSSAGSGSTLRSLRTKIPGVHLRGGEKIIRRVYAKADVARNVEAKIIQHFGTGGSPSADVEAATETWALTTSWQAFDIEATLPSIAGKTLGSAGDDGLILALNLPVNITMTIDFAMPQTEAGELSTYHDGFLPLRPEFGGTGGSYGSIADVIDNYNAIINGDFDIWQRGTSFSSIANAAYFADGNWFYAKSSEAIHDVSRSTDVPTVAQAGRRYNYSALVDCTTVDSSIGASQFVGIESRIEGFMFAPLAQRTITLSFWVKGTKTGIHCVALRNSGLDRTYVAEYTISASDTWEFKTITIAASPSAGTWDYATGVGIDLFFALAVGSTLQTTAESWATGNYLGSANQVNACDSTSNNFRITGVRLVAGSVAKPLIQRPYAQELLLAKRYYEIVPAGWAGAASSGNANGGYGACEVEKRTTPTVTWLSNMGALNFPTTTHSNFVFASTKAIFPFRTASGTGQDSRYHDLYAVSAEL